MRKLVFQPLRRLSPKPVSHLLSGLVFTLMLTNHAQADVMIDYDAQASSGGMHRLAIKGQQLRVDADDDTWILFNSNEQAMYIVDDSDRSYIKFDEALIEKLGQTMNRAKAELDAALADLPPAQRKQMQEMMAGAMASMLGGKDSIKFSVEETSRTDSVEGIDCRIVMAFKNDQPFNEVCLAEASDLGASSADAKVFRKWTQFTQGMMEQMAEQSQGLIPLQAPSFYIEGLGLPILSKDEDGLRAQLKSYRNDDIAASLFTIPKNYSEDNIDVEF